MLVDEDHHARVSDFGLSGVFTVDVTDVSVPYSGPRGSLGSVRWLAPEYIEGRTAKHMPGDVFAWACVALEVSGYSLPLFRLTSPNIGYDVRFSPDRFHSVN